MSNTAKSVLDVARSQIGKTTGRPYWDYVMGSGYRDGYSTPWCACFVSWCFHEAGARCAGLPAASCTYGIYPAAKRAGAVVDVSQARAGDVVLFNFDRHPEDAEHVGIVERVGTGHLLTIEGNTSAENDSHGGTVARRTRDKRYVWAVVRPGYDSAKPRQPESKRVNNEGLAYRAHVQVAGWLPVVHDGQVAGTVGQHARMEALQFTDVPEGVTLTANAHLQGVGWKSYVGIRKGHTVTIGTTGERRRLEAVQIHADGLPDGKRIRYRAHVQGRGWLPWVESGKTAGTTGESRRLEALQVEIVPR